MGKTLMELFARHSTTKGFNGNPMGVFRATIGKEEYEMNETPVMIGLYGGWYTVHFYPGECLGGQ
jgi:hypothetical protein